MKFIYCLMVILFCINTIRAIVFCSSEQGCSNEECCLKYGPVGWCANKVNQLGKNCGGKFRCGCADGLICRRFQESTVRNAMRIGNGTCVLDR